MGVDVGHARIGVALSQGSLALAHDTVMAGDGAVRAIAQLASEKTVERIYVGLPLSLAGNHTSSTEMALQFARELSKNSAAEVMLIDERLSTVSSSRLLRQAGKSSKEAKSIIDSESARAILNFALEAPETAQSIGEFDA